jgi:hypothetical protein
MTGPLDSLARLFLEPATDAPADDTRRWLPPTTAPSPPATAGGRRVAVVCTPRDARVAGGAAALALAHATGAPPPAILEWTGIEPASAPDRTASPATRRAATALRESGSVASAVGRLVRVALPIDEAEAAAEIAALSAGLAAFLLVAAGPRGAAIEQALAGCDRILLATRPDADEELSALAAEELGRLAPTMLVGLPPSPGAAALARSGTALVAPLRAPFLAALGIPA